MAPSMSGWTSSPPPSSVRRSSARAPSWPTSTAASRRLGHVLSLRRYDEVTLRLAAEAGAALALTTENGIASTLDAPLRLPRLDTNDLPLRGDASPWRGHSKPSTARGAAPVAAAR